MTIAETLLRNEIGHYRVLTGLRGWAALWVYLYHAWVFAIPKQITVTVNGLVINLTPFLSSGGAGVSIFFVLSGFLLALPFAEWQAGVRQQPALAHYLFRRVARVFPAYYVQLAVLLMVAHLAGNPRSSDLATIGRHLLMLFMPPPLGTQPLNGVWWTLPIEFSFYLLLPVLAWALRPSRWWVLLVGGLLVMVAWRYFVVVWWLAGAPIPERVVASYQLPGSMDMFSIGMLAALLHVNRHSLPRWILPAGSSNRLATLGLALLVLAIYWLQAESSQYWANNPVFYLWTPALSLSIAALVLSGIGGSRLATVLFGNPYLVLAGLCSYSIYLWHIPLLQLIVGSAYFQGMTGYRLPWLLAVSFPVTIAAGGASYLIVERPFMRMRGVSGGG